MSARKNGLLAGRLVLAALLLVSLAGCEAFRYAYYPEIPEAKTPVRTAYKYRLAEISAYNWLDTEDVAPESQRAVRLARKDELQALWTFMKSSYPEVFSEDGIPIKVRKEDVRAIKHSRCWWGLLTVGVIPLWSHAENRLDYSVACLHDGEAKTAFGVEQAYDYETNLFPLPWGLFFYRNPPEEKPGHKCFYVRSNLRRDVWRQRNLAIAYSVAVRLMEMEAAGQIDGPRLSAIERQIKLQKSGVPQELARPSTYASAAAYTILRCERESGSDFAYRFELELTGEDTSLKAFRAVQREFREAVKEDYVESVPGVRHRDLYVDFTEYRLNEGKIEGRAAVLTITPVSMAYNPDTRKGRMGVRISSNQYEEARAWIRKNIATLARDANIALLTDTPPPEGRFYLGKESLKDGNILEIEFRTE